jgi:LuxR family transcriptional regulator, maltose regulon positive regulatory protein
VEGSLICGSPAENGLGRLDFRLEPLECRKQPLAEPPSDADLVTWRTHVSQSRRQLGEASSPGTYGSPAGPACLNSRCQVAYAGLTRKGVDLGPDTPRRHPVSPASGALATSVAAADLLIPRAPKPLVRRPRLFASLDEGVNGPLTLISAAAGAGKTSLLASWLDERSQDRVAWLTLRPRITERVFWAEWLESIRQIAPKRSALSRLRAPRAGTPAGFVVQFLNGLAELDEPLTLVLDDFHEARNRALIGAVEQLLRAAPDACRLVLSTRHDPALPLHLFRASGELTELRSRDLAFTDAEARDLLNELGIVLDDSDFATLLERTEGWAAGLRLFTLSQARSQTDSGVAGALAFEERPAVEYLTAEALARQPEETRDFLLATSVVDRLTPDLADALTDRTDSSHLLERLVADNLFIERLDTRPVWYRYHRLFNALLRAELMHTRRSEVSGLHARAARWFLDHGDSLEAVRHALDAGDVKLVARCIVEAWFELVGRMDEALHGDFLPKISERRLKGSPELPAVAATIELIRGNASRAGRLLDLASANPPVRGPGEALVEFAELLRATLDGASGEVVSRGTELTENAPREGFLPQSADALQAIALAHLGIAELSLDRSTAAQTHLNEALELSRHSDVLYAELMSMSGLAWLELAQGRLRRAARIAGAAVERAETELRAPAFQTALAHAALALIEIEWDDLEAAESHANRLGEIATATDDHVARAWSALIGAALSLNAGPERAVLGLQQLRGTRTAVAGIESTALHRFAEYVEARLLCAVGERTEANALLERALRRRPDSATLLSVRARIRLAEGDADGALAALAAVEGNVTPSGATRRGVLRALALSVSGERPRAAATLEEALELAEPENIRRPFIDAGRPVRELLADHLRHSGSHRWFASELVRDFDGNGTGGGAPAELLDPLSGRELEVLRYLPTMMSNGDIAGELFVSVNTVKTHVKSIYRKLDATRRQDAVRRARQLHLL